VRYATCTLLKHKVIAHTHQDGWRVGSVYTKGEGDKYGKMIWVNYGRSELSACREVVLRYQFDPQDYGLHGIINILILLYRVSYSHASCQNSKAPPQKMEIRVVGEAN
jgi:hypothetical protein